MRKCRSRTIFRSLSNPRTTVRVCAPNMSDSAPQTSGNFAWDKVPAPNCDELSAFKFCAHSIALTIDGYNQQRLCCAVLGARCRIHRPGFQHHTTAPPPALATILCRRVVFPQIVGVQTTPHGTCIVTTGVRGCTRQSTLSNTYARLTERPPDDPHIKS